MQRFTAILAEGLSAQGAELAQTSADVLLVGETLSPVATAIEISRGTLRVVRQNLVWAIGYNSLALPLAALGARPRQASPLPVHRR